MIYTGLNRAGEIESVKAHGGADVSEVYGSIGESNPIYYKSITLTGMLPLSYKALGKSLSDYLISGNTLQNGTPSPDMPVDVVGCGEKTAQLFEDKIASCSIDASGRLISNSDFDMYLAKVEQGETYTASAQITGGFFATKPVIGSTSYNGQRMAFALQTVTAPITGYMTFRVNSGGVAPMFNLGSTAMPYEPYGYKLPLTVNGTEYPIYLGQVETTRKIKKLVLTGEEETWDTISGNAPYRIQLPDIVQTSEKNLVLFTSSHYLAVSNKAFWDRFTTCVSWTFSGGVNDKCLVFRDRNQATLADFKAYLAAQYAAGTPVTIWYVLATPETAVVNEPLMKIDDYADTISMAQAGVTIQTTAGTNTLTVGTTVQPSSVSITGHIKPVTS